jgi:hypothetical protein
MRAWTGSRDAQRVLGPTSITSPAMMSWSVRKERPATRCSEPGGNGRQVEDVPCALNDPLSDP